VRKFELSRVRNRARALVAIVLPLALSACADPVQNQLLLTKAMDLSPTERVLALERIAEIEKIPLDRVVTLYAALVPVLIAQQQLEEMRRANAPFIPGVHHHRF
jgi:hypothetical protein